MSKAFVKDEAAEDGDEDEVLLPPLPQGARNYITPSGYQRLRDELAHLVKTERPEVVRVVSWAASNGDRSENGDYLYGKKRLREIDRRIRFLTKRLDVAEVVDPTRGRRPTRSSSVRRSATSRPARRTRSRSSASTRSIRRTAASAGFRRSRARC